MVGWKWDILISHTKMSRDFPCDTRAKKSSVNYFKSLCHSHETHDSKLTIFK